MGWANNGVLKYLQRTDIASYCYLMVGGILRDCGGGAS